MKVVCIENCHKEFALTFEKTYEVIEVEENTYFLCDDLGNRCHFFKERFLTLEEFRNKKLVELGI